MPEIADALEAVGITSPFPIQEMTLSVALMGTDLIGQARTGTGKTLAFSIPVLQRAVLHHQQAGGIARLRGAEGDVLFGQVEVEICGLHQAAQWPRAGRRVKARPA